jgi:hypothetical protein
VLPDPLRILVTESLSDFQHRFPTFVLEDMDVSQEEGVLRVPHTKEAKKESRGPVGCMARKLMGRKVLGCTTWLRRKVADRGKRILCKHRILLGE